LPVSETKIVLSENIKASNKQNGKVGTQYNKAKINN